MVKLTRSYNYDMGFAVNGTPIPDPAVYTGKASALDTEGGRDATGTLHRNMVARKHPLKLEYHAIDFDMMEYIMSKMTGSSFRFTFPDPADGLITMKAYVGDRDWETIMAAERVEDGSAGWKKKWIGNLSFSIIEF